MVPQALRLIVMSLILTSSFLVVASLSTQKVPACAGLSCVQANPVIYDMMTSTTCIQNFPQAVTRIDIPKFSFLEKAYHPGETAHFAGSVNVWVDEISQDCFGFISTITSKLVSPSFVQLKVEILGSTQASTPSPDGSFSGSIKIPATQPGGDYVAHLTATFMGATQYASASFKIVSYNPELHIAFPTAGEGSAQGSHIIWPGEKIVVMGFGWIPNVPVKVDVDEKFNVTTDSQGNFQLEILIPEDDTFAEGNHTITVTQPPLTSSETFEVRYRALQVSIAQPETVQEYDGFTVSGNVTAQGTNRLVPGALVNVTVFGKGFTVRTDNNGFFRTPSISADSPPGTYPIAVNAIRPGYKPYSGSLRELQVVAATNLPAVVAAVGTGAAAGAGVSLAKRQIRRAKVHPHVSFPRTEEFCIHCGLQIKKNSRYCPKCELRLR